MGIAERDYAKKRPAPGGGFGGVGSGTGTGLSGWRTWSVTMWLIVINTGIFVLDKFFLSNVGVNVPAGVTPDGSIAMMPRTPIEAFGLFSTHLGFERLQVWRLVTFQFLHFNFWHLLFNMIGLYIFGRVVEEYMGRRTYLAFYLACGIFGGLLYLLLNLAGLLGLPLPGALDVSKFTSLIGASAGVFGVVVARAYITPHDRMQLLFPPIILEMRTLAYGFVGIAFLGLIFEGRNQGGEAAHIGGALAGFYFARRLHLLRDFFDVFENSNKKPKHSGRKNRAPSKHRKAGGRKPRGDDAEIDRILDKVQTEGLGALSESEKRVLSKASESRRDPGT